MRHAGLRVRAAFGLASADDAMSRATARGGDVAASASPPARAADPDALGGIGLLALSIFALGALWRCLHVLVLHRPTEYMWSDMAGYCRRALRVFDPAYQPHIGDTIYPPGNEVFLALLHALGGGSWTLAVHAQLAIALAIPIAIAALAHALYGRVVACVAAIIASLHFQSVAYAGYFLAENPFTLLLLLALLAALPWLRDPERAPAWRCALAGLLLGLAAAFKSVVLLPALLVAVHGALDRGNWRVPRFWSHAAVIGLALAAVIGPIAARNTSAAGRFTLISTNGSLNFMQGHSGDVRLFRFVDRERDLRTAFACPASGQRGYRRAVTLPFGPYDGERCRETAWEWIAAHPVEAAVESVGHVFVLFWGTVPWPSSNTAERPLMVLAENLFLLLVVAPAGYAVLRALRRRRAGDAFSELVLAAPVAGIALAAFVFIGDPRYRIPFDGCLIVLAAATWAGSLAARSTGRMDDPGSRDGGDNAPPHAGLGARSTAS